MIIIMSTNSMALITSRGKEKTKTLSEVTSAAISIPFFFFFSLLEMRKPDTCTCFEAVNKKFSIMILSIPKMELGGKRQLCYS